MPQGVWRIITRVTYYHPCDVLSPVLTRRRWNLSEHTSVPFWGFGDKPDFFLSGLSPKNGTEAALEGLSRHHRLNKTNWLVMAAWLFGFDCWLVEAVRRVAVCPNRLLDSLRSLLDAWYCFYVFPCDKYPVLWSIYLWVSEWSGLFFGQSPCFPK